MKEPSQSILIENIDLAISHGYEMNHFFTLVEKNGHYMPLDKYLSCHPLETVILGQQIKGPINVEIARNLGVKPFWIDGFIDGYSGKGVSVSVYLKLRETDSIWKHYKEGFDDGKELRETIANMEW